MRIDHMTKYTAKLKAKDRITLLETIPKEGGIATARIIHELRTRLGLGVKEIEGLPDFVSDPQTGTIRWDSDKERAKSFTFSAFEQEMIVASLRKLDEATKLTPAHLPLWDAFVGSNGQVSAGE